MKLSVQKTFRLAAMCILISLLFGCNHTVDDIEIVREPSLTLTINGEPWQPGNSVMLGFGKDLVYEADTSSEGVLYFSYRLILNGRSEQGLSRRITLRFAVPRQDELRGRYTTRLSERGGITDVEILEQLTDQQYTLYKLAPGDSTTFIQIDRQSTDKRLIAGSFAFTVINADTTKRITGGNGVFTDISYQKWQNSNL